jgi:hypothetical protein
MGERGWSSRCCKRMSGLKALPSRRRLADSKDLNDKTRQP